MPPHDPDRAALWSTLISGRADALIAQAAAVVVGDHGPTPSSIARLRAIEPDAGLVACALELAQARAKLAAKWGPIAPHMFSDKPGAEMASSILTGSYKAARFAELGLPAGSLILDACCGAGADSLALAGRGFHVRSVDTSPARVAMTRANAAALGAYARHNGSPDPALSIDCRCVDALDASQLDGINAMHIDPSQRTVAGAASHSRRMFGLDELVPPISAIMEGWTRHVAAHADTPAPLIAAIKLGPGANLEAVADQLHPAHIDVISQRGHLKEAVAWLVAGHGTPKPKRAAVLLNDEPAGFTPADALRVLRYGPGHIITLRCESAIPPLPTVGPLGKHLYEPDDAIERAGLLGELCRMIACHMPHPQCGLLTSTADERQASPWLTAFEVLAEHPWSSRHITAQLAAVNAGQVEVKTRGNVVDADALTRQLRGSGPHRITLFVVRFGDAGLRAIIARRLLSS